MTKPQDNKNCGTNCGDCNMKFSYYPGCTSVSTGVEFEMSVQYVAKTIGMELDEIEDWNCCGATAAHQTSHLLSIALPARNLAIAAEKDADVAIPCASCFLRMKNAQKYVTMSQENQEQIEEILQMPYDGKNQVYSMLEIMSRPEIAAKIKEKIKYPVEKTKIASYYGCLLVRPMFIADFDDDENPMSMDKLMEMTGATAVDWAFKTECCGASHQVDAPKAARDPLFRIIKNAVKNGAECIVTACPLCMLNLDMRMNECAKKHGEEYRLPIYYFTQVLAIAMGADPKEVGVHKHFTPAVDFAFKMVNNQLDFVSQEKIQSCAGRDGGGVE